ncbi:DUF4224 domain-containing protein [Collimonas arenae]|uniref:DUF4224 domain-containing protein n=1 Tax=Collimonas arenae TaxID=279058 RepID=UPI0009E09AC3|nr:DUF4224 domain-containing protein [Collimonas arenae]
MFLGTAELTALTNRKRNHAQRAVMNALGIQHKVRPDGSLAVLRAHVEKEFGLSTTTTNEKKIREPNWGALNATRS